MWHIAPRLEVGPLVTEDLEAHGFVVKAVPPDHVHGADQCLPCGLVLMEQVPTK